MNAPPTDRKPLHFTFQFELLIHKEDKMSTNTWEANTYVKHAHFVADLASPVIELLNPQKGEHILDSGCGDGRLTKALQDLGCIVKGVDYSDNLVRAAKALGLDTEQMDARHLTFDKEFDAVFSNAALDETTRKSYRRCKTRLKTKRKICGRVWWTRQYSEYFRCLTNCLGRAWHKLRRRKPLVFPNSRRIPHSVGKRRLSRGPY
jgi:SAM-dependent methyltransferase